MLEICCANIASALNAQAAGADRIELCDNLWEGGTTPSFGMLKVLRQELKIQIFVLIRPRGGDFLYSDAEFNVMLEDIFLAKELGADGIVSGILKGDGTVDCDRTIALIEAASPLPFTFHRAFDCCRDLNEALDDIIFCGAKRILTSGGKNSVPEGIEILSALNKKAAARIIIMPGGGINSENIKTIKEKTGCSEFHLSAKKLSKSEMGYHKEGLFMNGSRDIQEDGIFISDAAVIAEIKKQLL
jgi:copper homeostasis protein